MPVPGGDTTDLTFEPWQS